ncbi:MAG: hypothetical protein WC455_16550 [Dehalococcoidia bacterium]
MSDEQGVSAEVPEVSATPEAEVEAGVPDQQESGVTPETPGQDKDSAAFARLRRENKAYERNLAAIQAKLDAIEARVAPVQEEFKDDDILTMGDLRKRESKRQAEEAKRQFQDSFRESVARASANDDFEDRMAVLDELIATNPTYRGFDKIIMDHPRGPEIAYELAETLMNRKQAEKKGQVSKKLDANLGKPPPVVGGSASPVLDETQRIAKMNPLGKEFDEMVRRVEGFTT